MLKQPGTFRWNFRMGILAVLVHENKALCENVAV